MNATKTYPTLEIDIHKIETGRGWLIMKEGEPGESPEEAELEFIDDLRARKRDAARKRDVTDC